MFGIASTCVFYEMANSNYKLENTILIVEKFEYRSQIKQKKKYDKFQYIN